MRFCLPFAAMFVCRRACSGEQGFIMKEGWSPQKKKQDLARWLE